MSRVKTIALNLKGTNCPRCGATQPTIRLPKNLYQLIWGGYTCSNCQMEMDKFGRPIKF
jgi:transposase-like protein